LCHTGCSKSLAECTVTIFDQVLSPLIVAANVATLGASSTVKAGAEAVKIGTKTAYATSKSGYYFLKLLAKVQSFNPAGLAKGATLARRIKLARTGGQFKRTVTELKVYGIVYSATAKYTTAFAEDFVGQTSQAISDELERGLRANKKGDIEIAFIKAYWGEIQVGEVSNQPCVNHKTA
jgi:hypothetical protein